MPSKLSEIESQLQAARDELAAAEVALATIVADEGAAVGSPTAHTAWRAKRDNALGEVERRRKLLDIRDQEAAEYAHIEAEANQRQRHAEAVKRIAALEVRIPQDLAQANAIQIALLRDAAALDVEIRTINGALPAGLEPLASADFFARGRPALPRQEVSRERIWLWTRIGSGAVIGDQSAVHDLGGGRGIYNTGVTNFKCEAKLFDKVEFNPPEPMERPQPLFAMKLVRPDGPGFAFDGDLHGDPRAVLAALSAREAPRTRKRPVEFELIPVVDGDQADAEPENSVVAGAA